MINKTVVHMPLHRLHLIFFCGSLRALVIAGGLPISGEGRGCKPWYIGWASGLQGCEVCKGYRL